MGFVKEFRPACAQVENIKKLARESNPVTRDFIGNLEVTTKEIGAKTIAEFSTTLRKGDVLEALTSAKPAMAGSISESNAYIQSMKREANSLPDSDIGNIEKVKKDLNEQVNLDSVNSKDDLENIANQNKSLKKKIDDIEKRTSAKGGVKKYVFAGVAVVGVASFYEAIEHFAKAKTGCFYYTKDDAGKLSVCKILGQSCLNPDASSLFPTCDPTILPDALKNIDCKDWNQSTNGACLKCSNSDLPNESDLPNNAYLQCVEKPSFSDAMADFFYTNGIGKLTSISDSLGGILPYILYGGLIIIGIFLLVWILKAVSKHKAAAVVVPALPMQTISPMATQQQVMPQVMPQVFQQPMQSGYGIQSMQPIPQNQLPNAGLLPNNSSAYAVGFGPHNGPQLETRLEYQQQVADNLLSRAVNESYSDIKQNNFKSRELQEMTKNNLREERDIHLRTIENQNLINQITGAVYQKLDMARTEQKLESILDILRSLRGQRF